MALHATVLPYSIADMNSSDKITSFTEDVRGDSSLEQNADHREPSNMPDVQLPYRRGMTRRDLLMIGIGGVAGLLGGKGCDQVAGLRAEQKARREREDQEFRRIDMALINIERDAQGFVHNDIRLPEGRRIIELRNCLQRVTDLKRQNNEFFNRSPFFSDRARRVEGQLQAALAALENR